MAIGVSDELRAWLETYKEHTAKLSSSYKSAYWLLRNLPALIDKCEELAGALDYLVAAARGVPHNGDNLVMGTLDVAIEVADAALRAPGGGEG